MLAQGAVAPHSIVQAKTLNPLGTSRSTPASGMWTILSIPMGGILRLSLDEPLPTKPLFQKCSPRTFRHIPPLSASWCMVAGSSFWAYLQVITLFLMPATKSKVNCCQPRLIDFAVRWLEQNPTIIWNYSIIYNAKKQHHRNLEKCTILAMINRCICLVAHSYVWKLRLIFLDTSNQTP